MFAALCFSGWSFRVPTDLAAQVLQRDFRMEDFGFAPALVFSPPAGLVRLPASCGLRGSKILASPTLQIAFLCTLHGFSVFKLLKMLYFPLFFDLGGNILVDRLVFGFGGANDCDFSKNVSYFSGTSCFL